MDDLTYAYETNKNRLSSIADAIPGNNYGLDIDNQAASNYGYDLIGNMTSDKAEVITPIEWTVYGKIASITKRGVAN